MLSDGIGFNCVEGITEPRYAGVYQFMVNKFVYRTVGFCSAAFISGITVCEEEKLT